MSIFSSRTALIGASSVILTLAAFGCKGEIVDPGSSTINGVGNNGAGNNGAGNNGLGGNNGTPVDLNSMACTTLDCVDPVEPCVEPPCEVDENNATNAPVHPSPTTRFARLTHLQWENTVRDLLRLPDRPNIAATFIADPTSTGFSTNTASLDVTSELWNDYQRGAEDAAALVVGDDARLSALLGSDLPADPAARRDAFLDDLLYRAFRRPVTEVEKQRYAALFDRAAGLIESGDAFRDGVELTIRAVLQSPNFVFRVELSDEGDANTIPLNGFEVATRLSYTLWDTAPTEELLDAAGSGELDTLTGIQGWIVRMLDHTFARDKVLAFHNEWLKTNVYADITKDAGRFPEFTGDSGLYMQAEAELFVEDVIFEQDGSFVDLLTSRRTFVNANLASIYGLDPSSFGDDFTQVDLDASERSGLFTRIGFLAQNASALNQDPIHRGVFLAADVLCKEFPAPPDNVPPLPPEGNTVRERVDGHTGAGTCGAGCHAVYINPPGFAFEHYDALGRYQELENGFPINAADVYEIDGSEVTYDGAIAFSDVVAASFEANACYTRHWLEYMYGRTSTGRDSGLVAGIAEASRTDDLSIRQLIIALLLNDAFLTRAPLEETQ